MKGGYSTVYAPARVWRSCLGRLDGNMKVTRKNKLESIWTEATKTPRPCLFCPAAWLRAIGKKCGACGIDGPDNGRYLRGVVDGA